MPDQRYEPIRENQNNDRDSAFNEEVLRHLRSIDRQLDDLAKNGSRMSQSNYRTDREEIENTFRNRYSSDSRYNRASGSKAPRTLFDGIEEGVYESLFGKDFKKKLKNISDNLAYTLGVDLQDLPGLLGKELSKSAVAAIKAKAPDIFRGLQSSRIGTIIENQINREIGKVRVRFDRGAARSQSGAAYGGSSFDYFVNLVKTYGANASVNLRTMSATNARDQARANMNQARASQFASTGVFRASRPDYDSRVNKSDRAADSLLIDSVSTIIVQSVDSLKFNLGESESNRDIGESIGDSVDLISDVVSNVSNPSGLASSASPEMIQAAGVDMTAGGSEALVAAGAQEMGLQALSSTAAAAGPGIDALVSGLTALGPAVLALIPIAINLGVGMAVFGRELDKLKENFSKFMGSLMDTINRQNETNSKMVENANERMLADIKSMVEEPFNILRDAAQALYDAWDNNIRTINQTQGYTKADLQDLIASYAQRLREDGLASVVSSADITTNLEKVLQSGLSGAAAEEFSYIATVLNAAIPTQDFFNYASTYAQLAATAMQNGKSQTEAIEYANKQLEAFANDILYASRELTGGFTTGLQNAGELLTKSVQIAQASKTGDASSIAGVLTSISAVIGSIAPDLANTLVDAVVNTAIGGNSSQLVALRSLAGVNASNTEFLKKLADDPKTLFADLFAGLAKMQGMSEEAYMEVAEGLSTVFGLPMDALARVDFNYLAQQIRNMNEASGSLQENLSLLGSGQSTTSAEILRMQQINEYMINEGLAYVLDNAVAREIQNHMWDEQIAAELMENEYAVNLKGSALEVLESGKNILNTIWEAVSFQWLWKTPANIYDAFQENNAQKADITALLEAGKVGQGNARDLGNLTTYGRRLGLIEDITTLMTGSSAFSSYQGAADKIGDALWIFGDTMGADRSEYYDVTAGLSAASDALASERVNSGNFSNRSSYAWGHAVGKEASNVINSMLQHANVGAPETSSKNVEQTDEEIRIAEQTAKLNQMLAEDYIADQYALKGKSYEEWAASAEELGIEDLSKAIEEAGYRETDIQNLFMQYQAQLGAQMQQKIMEDEQDFRDKSRAFYDDQITKSAVIVEMITLIQEHTASMLDTIEDFYKEWTKYYIEHEYYDKTYSYDSVAEIQARENLSKEDAIYALAETLTDNFNDFSDPQLQTNALLAQILLVAKAIMQQNNKETNANGFVDSLMSLATGASTSGTTQ